MIENFSPKNLRKPIKIIGCGLAGAEVALILANHGFDVHIFDNNQNNVGGHKFNYYDPYQFCKTENMISELENLNSPLLSIAKKFDFKKFGFEYDEIFMRKVREELFKSPRINFFDATIENLCVDETTVVATGHFSQPKFLEEFENYIGKQHLCFYDFQNIVLSADSLDFKQLNFVSATECYANLSEEEYVKLFEKICEIDKKYQLSEVMQTEKQITIEGLARSNIFTLRNTIFRPHFAEGGIRPYASIKMTHIPALKIFVLDDFCSAFDEEEQMEILQEIEVFKTCNILRYSNVKRKTYLLSPACLNENMQISENIYVCGGLVGTNGSFETLLMANYCAYSIISQLEDRKGLEFLRKDTCIGEILTNLIEKSVIKFRLFNLKYDIIFSEDVENLSAEIEKHKQISQTQIEKFKEKFYGKYF